MIKVTTIGIDELKDRIKNASRAVQAEAAQEVATAAAEFEAGAVKMLVSQRGDTGTAARLIDKKQINTFTWEVFSGAFYSPYLEWGTITHVRVPAELQSYAIQFKGKGILTTGGIIPTPFFFPNVVPVRENLKKRLETVLSGI